jgi:hypothetical protein
MSIGTPSFSTSMNELLIYRFITGVGLGAAGGTCTAG